MTLHIPTAFLLAVLAIELTPGPNMGYLAIVASRWGRRAGLAAVAGVTLGLLIYLMASVVGLAEAALRWPWLYQGLRWAGVAYLLWLAWDAWRDAQGEAGPPRADGLGRLFRRGLVANLLNPKAALLYVALLPRFIAPEGDAATQALALGAVHLGVSLAVHLGIVLAAGGLAPILNAPASRRGLWFRRGMALALAAVAVWLAFSTG